jgi:hypothetical protein
MICHYAQRDCVECRILFSIMLSVVVLSVNMLNVVILKDRTPSVVAPYNTVSNSNKYNQGILKGEVSLYR